MKKITRKSRSSKRLYKTLVSKSGHGFDIEVYSPFLKKWRTVQQDFTVPQIRTRRRFKKK